MPKSPSDMLIPKPKINDARIKMFINMMDDFLAQQKKGEPKYNILFSSKKTEDQENEYILFETIPNAEEADFIAKEYEKVGWKVVWSHLDPRCNFVLEIPNFCSTNKTELAPAVLPIAEAPVSPSDGLC